MTIDFDNPPLTTRDFARLIDRTPDTVRAMERRGLIHAIKTANGQRLFPQTEAERIIRERAARSAQSR